MKKLLSLLSVLTISGTAVPTTIAASPYQKEEKLNSDINYSQKNNLEKLSRTKRGVNDGTEIHYNFWKRYIYASFKPEFLEELYILKGGLNSTNKFENMENFGIKFADKINNGIWKDYWVDSWKKMKQLGWMMFNDWDKINNVWQQSNKKNRIKFICSFDHQNGTNHKSSDVSVEIISSDTISYSNWYFSNLEKDFNNDLNIKEINLGLIENNDDNYILNKIKEKYPNLDIKLFEVYEKTEYSNFSKNYKAKIKVINNSYYSQGILKPEFVYITKTKLKELSDKIQNDFLVKQWVEHLNDYNKDLPQKIENLKKYVGNEKLSAKNIEKEIIKSYIRDFNQIIRLIELEWKIEELNKTVQDVKEEINNLKNKIKELEENNIISNKNCSNNFVIGANIIKLIPVIGSIGSSFVNLISNTCAIANA